MPQKPKVGLITFGDPREHEWNHVFKALAEPRHQKIVEYLKTLPLELVSFSAPARHKEEIDIQAAELRKAGVEALIAHLPCWSSPNLAVRGIQGVNLPTVVFTTIDPATHGSVGLMGVGGALAQIGFEHMRVREDLGTPAFENKVLPYLRAASAVKNLRGKEFGLFGGRSLGIDTATMDPMQWRALFGVDVEHVDQLEIIKRAEKMDPARAEKFCDWLAASVKSVHFEAGFTKEKFLFQAACYLAVKDLTQEKRFDFIGIKCMPDLATDFVPQCLSAALMGEPQDGEGPKKPVVMGCEADADGALTMEILALLTGLAPFFGDVSHIWREKKTMALPNCGGFCTWYAGHAEKTADNLKHVELRPSIRRGGGGIPIFTAKPGPLTLARLYRKNLEYSMAIIPAEAVRLSEAEEAEFAESRGKHQLPLMYAKVECDLDHFMEEYGSNHISAVGCDCAEELVHFCRLSGITPVLMDKNF